MSSSASKSAPRARDSWSGQTGFLLAAIGSAIGLGNIWRFPGVSYSNGGGAFLVPYLVALISVGLPTLWPDYAVGHKFRGSPPWALRKIIGGGEFIGWFQTFVCFVIMVYYGAVLAWGVQYTIYSVNAAWGDDPTTFFTDTFLQVVPGDTFSWAPAWSVMIPLALVWVLVLFVIGRGLSKGVEAANKVFLPLLVILFLALVVRALFLPGAVEGLNAFFTPNWGALADPKVWLAAFAQIFYSLSVGFGIMLTYASYLQRKSNLTGTALVAGFANSSFEILAGIGVFSAVGFMAHQGGVSVSEVEGLTGPILSFVTFPKIISMMPGGPIFGVLFFSSLVLAGVTSLLSLLQVVSGGLQDKFGWSPARSALVLGVPATVISLVLFGTRSGLLIALYRRIDERQAATAARDFERTPKRLSDVARLMGESYMSCFRTAGPECHAIFAALKGDEDMERVQRELTAGYVEFYRGLLAPYAKVDDAELHRRCVAIVGAGEALSREMSQGRVEEADAAATLAVLIEALTARG